MPLLGFTQFIPKIITGLTRQEITEQARQYLLDHCKEAEPGSPLEYAMRLSIKRCTIRKRRKNPIKVGDTLYMYKTYQQRAELKLGEAICIAVIDIVIDAKNKTVELAGKKLGRRTLAELVKADGFSTKNDFFTYFEKSSENGIFDGVLIKW